MRKQEQTNTRLSKIKQETLNRPWSYQTTSGRAARPHLFWPFPYIPKGSPAFPPSPVNMYRYPSRPKSSWPPLWLAAGSSISRMTLEGESWHGHQSRSRGRELKMMKRILLLRVLVCVKSQRCRAECAPTPYSPGIILIEPHSRNASNMQISQT